MANRLYLEALSLWHGATLSEFTEAPRAEAEAARLTELQLAAREELIDLELAAGRHTDVLGELEALTAAHPLRERLHARLMLALYRAGRQADALAAYERARCVLDAELGLRPSAELRNLQAAILQQRPDLRAPDRVAPVRTPPPTAHRLPPRLTSFLGREEDLHRLARLLREHRLVTVTGPGGVGKTSLAVKAARPAAGGFSDGVGFVRLAGVTDRAQAAHAALAALDVRDVPTATAEDRLLGHLRDRAALLVLDSCEHRPRRPRSPRRAGRGPRQCRVLSPPGRADRPWTRRRPGRPGLRCRRPGRRLRRGRLLGAAARWREKRHRAASRLERVDAERAEHRARGLLDETEFERAYCAGAAQPDAALADLEAAAAHR